jgi:hypothetical protein
MALKSLTTIRLGAAKLLIAALALVLVLVSVFHLGFGFG